MNRRFYQLCVILSIAAMSSHAWEINQEVEVDKLSPFSFRVALVPQNVQYLDELFWEISNPKSDKYGQFLSNEQISELIRLPEEEIQSVENHFSNAVGRYCPVSVRRSLHQDYLLVNTCVAQAELIFPNLNLVEYQNADSGKKIIRSSVLFNIDENFIFLSLPFRLHSSVAGIYGVTDLPIKKYALSKNGVDPSEPFQPFTKQMTINDMIKLYQVNYDGIDASTLGVNDGQVRQAVIEFDDTLFKPSDLKEFQKKYDRPINPIRKVIGTEEKNSQVSLEVSLDVQTITGLSGSLETWDFVFDETATWADVVEGVMAIPDAPKTLSCSWLNAESDYTKTTIEAQNVSLCKLGLAGFSAFFSSGDGGPAVNPSDCDAFDAGYPATSPYVVAVGGTVLDKDTNEEVAWIHSGGGFSKFFKRPSYQDEVVDHYLKSTKVPSNGGGKVYNPEGAAYPDVSAIAAFEPILIDGVWNPVYGTSESCPQFAAVIAMINVLRYQKGLGPLGSLNQALYQLDKGVGFDVTLGQSYASPPSQCGSKYLDGFTTSKGWDPVTGLGTPLYPVLLEQFLHLGESLEFQTDDTQIFSLRD